MSIKETNTVLQNWRLSLRKIDVALHDNDITTFIEEFSDKELEYVDDFGNTYLHKAITLNRYKIIDFLLSKKANCTKKNKWGLTSLDKISENCPVRLQKILAKYSIYY
jgi:ankyrin repeat protein